MKPLTPVFLMIDPDGWHLEERPPDPSDLWFRDSIPVLDYEMEWIILVSWVCLPKPPRSEVDEAAIRQFVRDALGE